MVRRSWLPILGALLVSLPALAADEPITKVGTVEGITEYKLANGFRVLLFPDASKPLVTVNNTIFVGSRHEGYGETGMAHLLEHMVFKGTPTFPDVPKALRDHGAGNRFNGTTWVDRTNYYETMPATDENLEFGIKLEADRLVNSYIKREDLISEMTVVRNEFESGENDPERVLSQRMMANAYEWHNYGKSTIGNRSDIERVPIDNLQAFYRKYYRVDNAMLVIAGQFDEKKALEYVVKYFGSLKKPATKLTNTYTEEPAQDGEREVVLRRVGAVGATGVVYHIPALSHEDFAAIETLSDCLTSAPAGRLYKALVDTKKASSVSGNAFGWHDPGLLEVLVKIEDAKGVDAARDAMLATLEKLSEKPITDEEVTRAKQKFKRLFEQLLSTSDQLAVQLSEAAGAGDWRLFFHFRDRLEKVTAADVNRVAEKYLVRSNRTVGVYYPSTKAERTSIPETPNIAKLLEGYKGRAVVAAGESFDPTPENIEKRVVRGEFGGIKTAFLNKKSRGEMVDLRLNLRYGNEDSLKGLTTAATLMSELIDRGTTMHTRQQITDAFSKLGATVSFDGQPTLLSVGIKVKTENLAATLKLVGEVLREPSFPEAEFAKLKTENIEALSTQKTDPIYLGFIALERKLQPYAKDNVRYVPTIEESIALVKAATVQQVKDVYAQLNGQAGELVAVGDFDPKAIEAELAPVLSNWKSSVVFKRVSKPAMPVEKGETIKIDTPDKENAVFISGITFPMTDSDPEYPAMQVGNYLLGGAPLASRLSKRVRGEEGLSYGIQSGVKADFRDKAGSMRVMAITNPKNLDKLDKVVAEEIGKFLKEGVSLEELDSGKKALVDTYKVQRADDRALASQLADGLFAGRTMTYFADLEKKIEGLSPGEIQKAYGKILDTKKLIIIHAGDFSKVKK